MTQPHLWLRAETKPKEKRTALTPKVAEELLRFGMKLTIEESDQSIFSTQEYPDQVEIVPAGSWKNAPKEAYIIGLKELPETNDPLIHKHIMFAHCYKQQQGWKEILTRFDQGKGMLYDLEFLVDDKGRRVAAFGYHAGFAGAALGLDVWMRRILSPSEPIQSIEPFENENSLIQHLKKNLAAVLGQHPMPRMMVMGALGRCGSGALDLAKKVGIPMENVVQWDMKETAKGGPFTEILDNEIFINCIYLSSPIPPFLTKEMLKNENRKLSVLVDVSCDPTNPHNPIPIYSQTTTFDSPVLTSNDGKPLDIIAIDHLPSLLPREASDRFCMDLLPTLKELKNEQLSRTWNDAEKLFHTKVQEMKRSP